MRNVEVSDYPQIYSWFEKRKMPRPPHWVFSDEGFIVPAVAAGFLYLTNSGVAHIDCYISNPDQPKWLRNQSLWEITKTIVLKAEHEFNIKMLCCNTKIKAIELMAREFGFVSNGQNAMFSKPL